jgi:HSP20 family protein
MTMTRLITYAPFGDTRYDGLLRSFFQPARVPAAAAATIRMDVAENDKAYVVHAEIPGAKKDDVQVTIEGDQVTIAAEVKRETEAKEGTEVLRSERFYGSYWRSFTLPVEIDEAASNAKFEDGVLELTLAKKAASAGRRLTIQ